MALASESTLAEKLAQSFGWGSVADLAMLTVDVLWKSAETMSRAAMWAAWSARPLARALVADLARPLAGALEAASATASVRESEQELARESAETMLRAAESEQGRSPTESLSN
eukprot:CAMPEP_0171721132 /NCGR_PEP_ID=MMETSP0991-20121206/22200_1 /TAXON_ID=483369 /ORGANISM="non described non described, Strain CCMP2098" /LENGTH=112 /DNA_ID=CAMNT_0012312989 /DNA_START=701 /DNA_END=1039 /DNA_ORIENTATION=+